MVELEIVGKRESVESLGLKKEDCLFWVNYGLKNDSGILKKRRESCWGMRTID